MHTGKCVFAQIIDHLPWHSFDRFVPRCHANRKAKSFRCSAHYPHYLCMVLAQLTNRESFRDIEMCLRVPAGKPNYIARSSIDTIAIVDSSFCKDKLNKGSSKLRWWAQKERIRTLAELPFQIDFHQVENHPLYQEIVASVLHPKKTRFKHFNNFTLSHRGIRNCRMSSYVDRTLRVLIYCRVS